MKSKTHKFVINTAIDKLNIPLYKEYRKYLLKGSVKADFSFWHLFLGSFTHFYDPLKEKGYFMFKSAKKQGGKFFNKSLKTYRKGKIKKSMIYLGIAIHLLEDTAMPSHSKPRFHFIKWFQDSLENFMNKNIELMKLYVDNVKITIKGSLNEYFEDLANASRDFKQGKVGFFPFLARIFIKKTMTKKDLEKQTKELTPLAISYTMGLLNEFYKKIN